MIRSNAPRYLGAVPFINLSNSEALSTGSRHLNIGLVTSNIYRFKTLAKYFMNTINHSIASLTRLTSSKISQSVHVFITLGIVKVIPCQHIKFGSQVTTDGFCRHNSFFSIIYFQHRELSIGNLCMNNYKWKKLKFHFLTIGWVNNFYVNSLSTHSSGTGNGFFRIS